MQLLMHYDWPGNVRQLENAVFRAVVLADEPVLTPEEFPHIAAHLGPGEPLAATPAVAAPNPVEAAAIEIAEPASSAEAGRRNCRFR